MIQITSDKLLKMEKKFNEAFRKVSTFCYYR